MRTSFVWAFVGLLAIGCSSSESGGNEGTSDDGGADSGSSNEPSDGGPGGDGPSEDASSDDGGSTSDGGAVGACAGDGADETFGFTDATKFVLMPSTGPSSIPVGGTPSAHLTVDGCGIHLLAGVRMNYSIHTWTPGKGFAQRSTKDIVGINAVANFLKIGDDFAVVANNTDNHSYLYRMSGTGGPLEKVSSQPLLNGDFGMGSVAVNDTHMFFNTYKSGAYYSLWRVPITAFATGTLPLEAEPMVTNDATTARGRVFVWGDRVAFGSGNYPTDCASNCASDDSIPTPLDLWYAIAGVGDTLYAWGQGDLTTRSRGSSTNITTVPVGLEIGDKFNDMLVGGVVSPDGTRVAILTRGPSGVRLHRINDAKSKNPTGDTLVLTGDVGEALTLWSNGKVVLIAAKNSFSNPPILMYGLAWGD